MAEDDDNLVLRLLREIRSEQAGERSTMQAIEGGITTIERHMEDVKDETTGQRLDRLTDRVAGLESRIEKLEKPR